MYQKKLGKLENHHINPISLKWPDIKENVASILDSKHADIHRTLDMNSRLHYNLVRKAREKTNHKLILWPDDLRYRHDAQELYFERIPRLDWFLRKLHLEKMNQLIGYELWRLKIIWINHEHEIQNTFEPALKLYHEYWIELAKEVNLIFKKWLWISIPQ